MKSALLALALGLGSCACVARSEAPQAGEPADFQARFGYLAVLPVHLELELETADEAGQRIEDELAAALEAAGFRVLPAAVGRAIRERMEEEVGGIADPASGRIDPAKLRVVEDYSARELLAEHAVDALVRPALVPVSARVHNTRAMWDGTSQKLLTFRARLLSIPGLDGSVRALSLRIAFEGRDGQLLYERQGGITLLARLAPGFRGVEKVPEAELWQDPSALRRAIDYALQPLRRAHGPSAAKRGDGG